MRPPARTLLLSLLLAASLDDLESGPVHGSLSLLQEIDAD